MHVASKKSKSFSGNRRGKRGLTSVSLNELVGYKNVVFLAAYSGLLTRLGNRQEGVGGRRRRADNGKTKQRSVLLLTDPHPFHCAH